MNRLAFVTNQKLQKAFNVLETLKIGSVWKSIDSNRYTRIKEYIGISFGKYVYDTEICIKPRWFKKNDWTKGEWRVDEIYLKYDFTKNYKRAVFVKPFSMETGFEKKNIMRTIAFIGLVFGYISILNSLISHKFEWWSTLGGSSAVLNTYFYLKALKEANE